MTAPAFAANVLLVEDNAGDAQLVKEFLANARREAFRVIHVGRLEEAVTTLRTADVDVVVLDLGLPDGSGVDAVKAVRQSSRQTPIVVLTGHDDDELASACIDAGAQDFLPKAEIRTQSLKRAIGYAVMRIREAQLQELQDTLARYRSMSSTSQGTSVTAALAGSGAISARDPEAFDAITTNYFKLLEPYLARLADRVTASRGDMERIVTSIGDAGGGPRDLLDVHLAALDRALALHDDPHTRTVVFEGRLLALEMMGLLVDYYRVGHRRRYAGGAT